MTPSKTGGANEGHSCVKGRFAWGYSTHPDRVMNPMIRETTDDPWTVVSWDEAIAELFKQKFFHREITERPVFHSARDFADLLSRTEAWCEDELIELFLGELCRVLVRYQPRLKRSSADALGVEPGTVVAYLYDNLGAFAEGAQVYPALR